MNSESFTPKKTAVLNNAGISNLSQISEQIDNKSLDGLKLISNYITKISPNELKNFSEIRYLNLSNNQIESLDFLPYLHKLTDFIGSQNFLKELKSIDECSSLQRVDLSSNKIGSVSLKNPTKTINSLDLSNNTLKNFDFGSYFPNICRLLLNSNFITDISDLKKFKSLRELHISQNNIISFEPFSFDSLSVLDISYNNITQLDCFTKFSNLVFLNVSGNPISEKREIPQNTLTKLKTLDLSYTKVKRPNFINTIAPNVSIVDLKCTKIDNEDDLLRFVKGSSSLTIIDIRGTPLSSSYDPSDINYQNYESLSQFNKDYPNNADERYKFRQRIIKGSVSALTFINAIKITNSELNGNEQNQNDDDSFEAASTEDNDSDDSDNDSDNTFDEKEENNEKEKLEKKNVDLRNEIIKLLFLDETKPITEDEKMEILIQLKDENTRLKKILAIYLNLQSLLQNLEYTLD